jgi:hypothetical protein
MRPDIPGVRVKLVLITNQSFLNDQVWKCTVCTTLMIIGLTSLVVLLGESV